MGARSAVNGFLVYIYRCRILGYLWTTATAVYYPSVIIMTVTVVVIRVIITTVRQSTQGDRVYRGQRVHHHIVLDRHYGFPF